MFEGTYDFNEVNLIFGVKQIKGFEEGTEIVAARDEDSFSAKSGVGGNVTRSKTNNSMGKITFTLSQFSEDNKYLQNIANLDERTGAGVLPAKVTDKSNPNTEHAIATESWIVKPSDKSFANASGPREWVIQCASLNFI